MGEPDRGIETAMATFAAQLRYDDLPADVVFDAKFRVLDWIGCALAGTRTEPARVAATIAREMSGAPQATVIRQGMKLPMSQAAWVNGAAGHVVEFDDGHRLAVAHPGAVTVPVALALGEHLGRSGKEIITAVVAGYEVLIRLGIAVSPSHYKYWHTTSTCGAFAADGVATSLLQLDLPTARMALGIAGTLASGLQETFGTHAKPLNIGHACQSGIQAALLAKAGFTGPHTIIMGKKGFVAATSTDRELTLLEQINNKEFLSHTAFYKMYSSCGHTHSPLDATFSLIQANEISAPDIRNIRIDTYKTSVDLTGQLKNQTETKLNFRCRIALPAPCFTRASRSRSSRRPGCRIRNCWSWPAKSTSSRMRRRPGLSRRDTPMSGSNSPMAGYWKRRWQEPMTRRSTRASKTSSFLWPYRLWMRRPRCGFRKWF